MLAATVHSQYEISCKAFSKQGDVLVIWLRTIQMSRGSIHDASNRWPTVAWCLQKACQLTRDQLPRTTDSPETLDQEQWFIPLLPRLTNEPKPDMDGTW
jgi:hypothetical protein